MAWPALDSGRLLEAYGDMRSRGMVAHDRTRLTGQLPANLSSIFMGSHLLNGDART